MSTQSNNFGDICAVNHGGNEFSVEANAKISPYKGAQRDEIATAFEKYPSGEVGQIVTEALGIHPNSGSARLAELKAADILIRTGKSEKRGEVLIHKNFATDDNYKTHYTEKIEDVKKGIILKFLSIQASKKRIEELQQKLNEVGK